ncbi:response regulator [Maricaulaceae bacterium MS644]
MDLKTLVATLGDHVLDSVLITEAEPVDLPGPRIVWVNEAFTRTTGYTLDDVIGKTPRILQGADVNREALATISAALKAWRPVRQILKNYTKDGEPFWIELDIKPVADSSGWYCYWLAVQRDVTDRVEQAEALRQARDEARSANRLKSEFLANMSHEIRTPLNGVLGMAQVLSFTDLDERQRRAVDTILASGRSLLGLIEDVLDLSRVEAGQLSLSPEPLTAREMVEQAGEAVRGVCVQKGLTLRIEPGDGADTPFMADPRRTRQILVNLAGNAAKFTMSGSVVIASRVEDRAGDRLRDQNRDSARGPSMVFEVRDTGPGVPPSLRAAIFERFRQGEASLSRDHEGVGLGLAIANELAALAGGALEVDDAPEGGAVFRVILPLITADPVVTPPPRTAGASEAAPSPARHALLVEDNPVNREVAEEALVLHGWRVSSEARAEPALKRLQSEAFDLVIMDREMPGLNGEEAIRLIRAMGPPVRDIPILMVTAHAMAGAREAALAAGADDYLAKPVVLDQMVAVAARLCERTAR